MTGQGTRGEGKKEMVVSITGWGVFLGRVGVFACFVKAGVKRE